MHIYNSTQKITIQGRKHKWFVENYLESFFKLRISKALPEIELINKSVLSTLCPDSGEQNLETLSEETESLRCDKCDFTTTIAEDLRTHIVNIHTMNIFLLVNVGFKIDKNVIF